MSDETNGFGGEGGAALPQPRLLEQVHDAIRRRYFSRRTEEAYPRPSFGLCQAFYRRGAAIDIMRLLREEIR
jgi:hypothetical protein